MSKVYKEFKEGFLYNLSIRSFNWIFPIPTWTTINIGSAFFTFSHFTRIYGSEIFVEEHPNDMKPSSLSQREMREREGNHL